MEGLLGMVAYGLLTDRGLLFEHVCLFWTSGVGGAIESPLSLGMTSPGGPTKAKRTGRKMRPLKRPRRMRPVNTKKKYLKWEGKKLVFS